MKQVCRSGRTTGFLWQSLFRKENNHFWSWFFSLYQDNLASAIIINPFLWYKRFNTFTLSIPLFGFCDIYLMSLEGGLLVKTSGMNYRVFVHQSYWCLLLILVACMKHFCCITTICMCYYIHLWYFYVLISQYEYQLA